MKTVAQLIKTSLPEFKELAQEEFDRNFHDRWDKPMYQENDVFKVHKRKYGIKPLTRQTIIDLFCQGKYYDGFLCAMVWGNMGTYRGGKRRFDGVFNIANEPAIRAKINSVIDLLQKGKTKEAYLSLGDKTNNGIIGVGEAFFTKLLYFAGAGIKTELHPEPVVFDRNMREVYSVIVKSTGEKKRGLIYFDYCNKMEELKNLLGLQTSGHVEALLFRRDIRELLCKMK